MSAETLREAARLMRLRAVDAKSYADAKTGAPLPWVKGPYGQVFDMGAAPVSVSDRAEDAAHIASWHPAVALAVADWLEDLSNRITLSRNLRHVDDEANALAVARAYLKRPAGG